MFYTFIHAWHKVFSISEWSEINMKNIEQEIHRLPKNLQQEVIDFMDFLIKRRAHKKKKKAGLGWIGGLKEYRNKYNSLDLQKKL